MINPSLVLPTEEDLPYTDDQPVDNELQLIIPILLRAILTLAWRERQDWFLGINMGVYYKNGEPAIGPDAFLSIGVPRQRPQKPRRLSYLVWQENGVVPQWVLEVVSQKYGSEYEEKLEIYREMGVLYYVIYNPDYWKRDRHDPYEVYQLIDGNYVRQLSNPFWMPELGLGIGIEPGIHDGEPVADWLYWYDADGNRLPAPENAIALAEQLLAQERQRAEAAEQRANQAEQQLQEFMERLKARGIDPEEL
jgi:Uma2 family endonuclease